MANEIVVGHSIDPLQLCGSPAVSYRFRCGGVEGLGPGREPVPEAKTIVLQVGQAFSIRAVLVVSSPQPHLHIEIAVHCNYGNRDHHEA